MNVIDEAPYISPPQAIEELLDSDWVTEPTRVALQTKLAGSSIQPPGCLSAREFAVLQAAVGRLVPQAGPRCVPIAEIIASNLTSDRRDGWRYDELPCDQEAYSMGLQGLDETARCLFACGFVELSPFDQEAVLGAVQDGWAPNLAWARVSPTRFFEELLAEAVEAYASHPFGLSTMRYRGMADAKGFSAVGLDQRDPIDIDTADAPV